MRSLVIACGSGAVAPHASMLVVNGAPLDPNASGVLVVGGGGGGGWPAALDVGLLYRFDAYDADSLTLSGADVTAWADLGPSGLDLARVDYGDNTSPTYDATGLGGGPCVTFAWNGSKFLRTCAVAYSAGGSVTVGVVYEPHASLWGGVLVHYDNSLVGVSLKDDPGDVGAARTHSNNDPPRAAFDTLRAPQVMLATLGSATSLRRNGASAATSTSNGTPADCGASGRLCIGGDNRFDTFNTHKVALVAAWEGALSSDQRTAFEDYCSRWTT